MRSYHRKTLIRKERWPCIDGWYWCPLTVVAERIEKERNRLDIIKRINPIWYSYQTWKITQYDLGARLAHACDDGRIRAPSWVEYYVGKGGHRGIYGKCRFCDTPISDGMKAIIIMEKEL